MAESKSDAEWRANCSREVGPAWFLSAIIAFANRDGVRLRKVAKNRPRAKWVRNLENTSNENDAGCERIFGL